MRNAHQIFRELYERTELSQARLAARMGYAGASSIQMKLNPSAWNGKPFAVDFVQKIEDALIGAPLKPGEAPITKEEVWELADLPSVPEGNVGFVRRVAHVEAKLGLDVADSEFFRAVNILAQGTANAADLTDREIEICLRSVSAPAR